MLYKYVLFIFYNQNFNFIYVFKHLIYSIIFERKFYCIIIINLIIMDIIFFFIIIINLYFHNFIYIKFINLMLKFYFIV